MGCASSSAVKPSQSSSGEKIGGCTSIHETFELGARLGEGAYARVYCLKQVGAGKNNTLAVKVTDLRKSCEDGDGKQKLDNASRRRADKEAHLLKLFQNQPHVIEFKGHHVEAGIHYILMEKCQYGFRHVLEQARVNEAFYASVFRQMLKALQVVHGLNVVHRDIKPDNFLFTQDFTVKLCDFGLAEHLTSRGSKASGTNGTPPYMSPEMVNAVRYNTKTDIWSFGVTAYLLLYGTFPYMPSKRGVETMKRAIGLGCPAPKFRPSDPCDKITVSDMAGHFLRALLKRDPSSRPSAKDALNHPWLAMASKMIESSLPSLQPMLSSARALGALGPSKAVFASPDELDEYLETQQVAHRGTTALKAEPTKAAKSLSPHGIVPQPQVPGTITASTLSNLEVLNPEDILESEESSVSMMSSELKI